MADFNNIIQEINTNLPDNNTQAITAVKMRTTFIDAVGDINTKKQDTLTFDSTPTENSANPVTSGGIYDALQEVSVEINKVDNKVAEINRDLNTFSEITTYETINQSVYPTYIDNIGNVWKKGGNYKLRKFNLDDLDDKLYLYTDFNSTVNTNLLIWTSSDEQEFPTIGTDYEKRPIEGFIKMEYPRSGSPYNNVELEIPDGAKFLYVAIYGTGTLYFRDAKINKAENRIEAIEDDIDSIEQNVSELLGNVDELNEDNKILFGEIQEIIINALDNYEVYPKMSLDRNYLWTDRTGSQLCHFINIENAKKLVIQPTAESNCVFFISNQEIPTNDRFTNAYVQEHFMVQCDGYEPFTADGVTYYYMAILANSPEVEITLNDDAKYLYWQVHYQNPDINFTPQKIDVYREERVGGIIEELSKEESNQGYPLKLVIKDGKCFTAPIPLEKGYYLRLKEPYTFGKSYLVSHITGEIVNDDYNTLKYAGADEDSELFKFQSYMAKMPGFDIVHKIVRINSGESITDYNNIVEEFTIVEDLYSKKMPTGISPSIYRLFLDKLQTNIGVVWTPSINAANRIPEVNGHPDTNFFRKGKTYTGVNYSGPTQFGKHIGIEVSMRTYITAIANPRSVMYTERIGSYNPYTAQSSYGFIHNSLGKEAGAYYGCVCTGLTSYMLGLDSVVTSSRYGSITNSWSNGMFDRIMYSYHNTPNVIVYNGNSYSYIDDDYKTLAEELQPMDFIWNNGHCAIISSIYIDEWGDVKYIVISEQTYQTSKSTAYTPKEFFLRYKNVINLGNDWQILRKKTWVSENVELPRTNQDKDFVIMDNSQYSPINIGEIDPDITTFAGEYAVFVIGDYSDPTNNFKLFLNIHRGGADGYTHIQIFNEDDDETTATPIEINITGYQTDSSLGTNGYILPTDEDEDWIIYNLAEYWEASQPNNTGKFKARVVRKDSGTITANSGFTHFMMVLIEFTESDNKHHFTVKGGTPVQIRGERTDGVIADTAYPIAQLTENIDFVENDGEFMTNTDGLTIPNYGNSCAYYRLVVKTDYGMASVRIAK